MRNIQKSLEIRNMNTKHKAFEDIIQERSKDLRDLILYFTITKVVRDERFCDFGLFSIRKWRWHRNNVNFFKFKSNPTEKQKIHFKRSSLILDEVLGIPNLMISKVLGCYGANQRVKFEDVLSRIGGEEKWICMAHGNYSAKDEDGNRVITSSWCRKVIFRNVKEWNSYFNDCRYYDIKTFPDVSKRLVKIISKYEATCNQILDFVAKFGFSKLKVSLEEKKVDKSKMKFLLGIAKHQK